jgi:hypothetical protein
MSSCTTSSVNTPTPVIVSRARCTGGLVIGLNCGSLASCPEYRFMVSDWPTCKPKRAAVCWLTTTSPGRRGSARRPLVMITRSWLK